MLKRSGGKLPAGLIEFYGPNQNDFYKTKDTLEYSISDFRPNINYNDKSPLYLTSKYYKILNDFLSCNQLPQDSVGIMKPTRSSRQSKKRKEFLAHYLKIEGQFWGNWKLYSYPAASSITFDSEMKYARVNFSMEHEGGSAILKKDGDQWSLISAKIWWIN